MTRRWLIPMLLLVCLAGCLSPVAPRDEVSPARSGARSLAPVARDTVTIVAGVQDFFALPVEPAVPDPAFSAHLTAVWPQIFTRQFDQQTYNRALVHTFTGWRGRVTGATLRIGLGAGDLGNDSVRLGFVPGSQTYQEAFRYWVTLRKAAGTTTLSEYTVLTLDLANLPDYGGFPRDILWELRDGRLEVLVEDDTAVDFISLEVRGMMMRSEDAESL